MRERKNLLQLASDGFFPEPVARALYREYFFVGPTAVNGWSVVHLLSGVATSRFLRSPWSAFLLHSAWEVFQFVAGDNKFDVETAIDITLDTAFFMVGFLGGQGS